MDREVNGVQKYFPTVIKGRVLSGSEKDPKLPVMGCGDENVNYKNQGSAEGSVVQDKPGLYMPGSGI